MSSRSRRDLRDLGQGLAFIAPNILGFLAFTAIPLVISFVMAFTDWNLETHNVFKTASVRFVGIQNFVKLINEPDFLKYLGNTLFFMMGIPFGVGGSLCAAILLSSDFRGGSRKVWSIVFVTILLVVSVGALVITGMQATALTVLVCGIAATIIVVGSLGGQTVYRTLFYFPHFTAGVATFILWKKLYSPENGPINNSLRPVLNRLAGVFARIPEAAAVAISGALTALIACVFLYSMWRKTRLWRDGDSGMLSTILGSCFLSVPLVLALKWSPFGNTACWFIPVLAGGWLLLFMAIVKGRRYKCELDCGMADAVILSGATVVLCMLFLGTAKVVYTLPLMASDGLNPPLWLSDYAWAKPSLMIMGLWGAIGSNNMLLYLAGLSGIPQELYEAADIDGARGFQRFWNVTWPQLANVTFFILVMAVIGGLQGGFEMARTMTQGGPAGATTTLSYFIYVEGFGTGQLGYACAISWALFAMVFCVTLFNWKFGNKYTND